MFKSHYLSGDPEQIKQYKMYNMRNKVKSPPKKQYFDSQFVLNKNNMKVTWKLIGMIIDRERKKSKLNLSSITNTLRSKKAYATL